MILGAGIFFALLMVVYSLFRAVREGIPRSGRRPSPVRVVLLLWQAKYAIGAPVLVLGGIYSGAFTPTEAGAIGCIYSFLSDHYWTRPPP
ncbi:TRAP transporter large permease subunit [uncultured Desulfobacter sp.]|uniref:TRAP transporter large permease subunit n=1 Tax=uncultured Desulfobacter sp. TaxID=240139 RepID=UPI0029F5CC48|nr:TRAP transporter large permease subunit [uncultured Desulfobacter sp.]